MQQNVLFVKKNYCGRLERRNVVVCGWTPKPFRVHRDGFVRRSENWTVMRTKEEISKHLDSFKRNDCPEWSWARSIVENIICYDQMGIYLSDDGLRMEVWKGRVELEIRIRLDGSRIIDLEIEEFA